MPDQRIAVVVAHPDDEVLGFGGAIVRHAKAGDHVYVLFLATGLAARSPDGTSDPEALDALRRQAGAAARILGVEETEFADFPDNRMDSVPLIDVVKRVEQFITERSPTTLYTHHAGDLNIDHQVTARAALTACRPQPGTGVVELLAGEVNSSTEWSPGDSAFVPTEFIDISELLDLKLQALECYEGELRDWPHPRSLKGVKSLARWRGTQVGLDAAEAFVLIRRICS